MAMAPPYMSSSSMFGAFANSPLPYQAENPTSKRSSTNSDSLAPPPSPYPQQVDPSPTDSNGTENTDIEEDVQDQVGDNFSGAEIQSSRPMSRESVRIIDTNTAVASRSRSDSDETPPSAIHVPADFKELVNSENSTYTSKHDFGHACISPSTPDAALGPEDKRLSSITSPLNTDIPLEQGVDRPTPRAQTRQEVEEEWKRRSRRTSSLEDIPETNTTAGKDKEDSQSRWDSVDDVSELPIVSELEQNRYQAPHMNRHGEAVGTFASSSTNHTTIEHIHCKF
ncbi:hypothetical protein KCU81_g681, partial [Aureobasidium melanogenum]